MLIEEEPRVDNNQLAYLLMTECTLMTPHNCILDSRPVLLAEEQLDLKGDMIHESVSAGDDIHSNM